MPTAHAQLAPPEPKFINISKESGLPSSETYFVHQDRKGYVWICTDRGVVRFDGYRYRVFTKKDGLTDDVVFQIVEGTDGKIWFVTMNSLLCYFDRGKIHSYRYNYLLEQHPSILSEAIKLLEIHPDNSISYTFVTSGRIRISASGKKTVDNRRDNTVIIDRKNNQIDLHLKRQYPRAVPVYLSVGIQQYFLDSLKMNGRYKLIKTNKHQLFVYNNSYYDLATRKKYSLGTNVISTYIHGDSLFVGRHKHGYSIWSLTNKKWIQQNLQNGKSISSLFIDKNKILWYSSLENGIYFAPNPSIKNYTAANGLINDDTYSVTYFRKQIFVGFMSFGWQQLRYPFLKDTQMNNVTYTTFAQDEHNLYINVPKVSVWRGSSFVPVKDPINLSIYRYMVNGNGKIYTHGNSIYTIRNNELVPIYRENFDSTKINEKYFRIKSILFDGPIIWKGTDIGLSYIKDQQTYADGLTKKPFNARITYLAKHPKWGNIATTKAEGFFTFRGKQLLGHWTTKHGLLSDNINCLEITPNGDLLLGTNNGLNLIKKQGTSAQLYQLTESNGLISNEINDIAFANDTIWVATKKGVSEFTIDELTNRQKRGKLFLESLSASSSAHGHFTHFFDAKTSAVYLDFRTDDYASQGVNRFRYKINGEPQWTETTFPEIVLNNLIWGRYSIQFEYLDQHGQWIGLENPVSFTIDKPVWLKWYSIIGYILLASLIIGGFIRFRISKIKREKRQELQLIELEQRALQAQMNPHFIFNSLNSIQSFLVYHENEQAERYLIKFAQLIRQIVSRVNESKLTIREEIELINTYLTLEKMRFKDKFNYSITHHFDGLELESKIPTMMIQPFVENAILHGFSTITSGGQLTIRFEKTSPQIITCIIEDNGIGRKNTATRKKETHLSLSSKVTQDRIAIFEKQFKGKFDFEVIDKPGDAGTIVRIQIPLMNE